MTKAQDPYKYFRVEARELIEELSTCVLNIEKGHVASENIASILRHAHTLKGASRVVSQKEISELAHAIEDILAAYRVNADTIPLDVTKDLWNRINKIQDLVQRLDVVPDAPLAPKSRPEGDELTETLRVDLKEMDSLLHSLSEAGVQMGRLRRDIDAGQNAVFLARSMAKTLNLPMADTLVESLEQNLRSLNQTADFISQQVSDANERAQELRLFPAKTIFGFLSRTVRDAAELTGKHVDFETSGGDTRLDANMLRLLRESLEHVIRNAVAHGIEPQTERTKLGKKHVGRIDLRVDRQGSSIVFQCKDDGRGIDFAAIRSIGVERGRWRADEALSLGEKELMDYMMDSGFSTSRNVDEVSGRGIGLDVVRDTITRLKGQIRFESTKGMGTVVELRVPISIESTTVLTLQSEDTGILLPLDSIRKTTSVAEKDVARSSTGDAIIFEGKTIPFVLLDGIYHQDNVVRKQINSWPTVVVQAKDRLAAVGCGSLGAITNVVIRPLPKATGLIPLLAGGSFDADGIPQPVLNPEALVDAAYNARGASLVPAKKQKPKILVIDDSLTTRMLEQSILESAGFDVDLAVSGEEGLEKARASRYGVFVVDVEMPGMNGFEFIAATRADAALRETPAILVTSLSSPEFRRKGEEVGAKAYIVKTEFDQGVLLKTIRGLLNGH